jgi:rhamnosyltransferase
MMNYPDKKSRTKRVLVLMATHNGIQWVDEQLKSIWAQEGVEVSILASDDASADGTYEYLNSASDVMLLKERGPYGSAGENFFNLLLRADFSAHDFIAFSDQDDIWHSWKLARAIDCLATQGCDGYSANVTAFWEDGREALVEKAQSQREWDFLFQGAGPGGTYVMSTFLAKGIQYVLQANPQIVDEICLHDWFVYAWARSNGFKWFIDNVSVMRYRQHDENEFGVNTGVKVAKNRIEKIKSGWYRSQVAAIAKVCGVESNTLVHKVLSKTWSGRLTLAMHAGKFRRSYRDALFLTFISLMDWF